MSCQLTGKKLCTLRKLSITDTDRYLGKRASDYNRSYVYLYKIYYIEHRLSYLTFLFTCYLGIVYKIQHCRLKNISRYPLMDDVIS